MSNEQCVELFSKIKNENIDKEIMRQSLSSITKELQRFHFYCGSNPENNLFQIFKNYKANLKFKKNKLKKLNEKIKTACIVAKTVITAKERESYKIQSHLAEIKNNSAKVIKENIKFQQIIHELTKENQTLCNKMNNLSNWINLGYEKLQTIRNEPIEEINLFHKFKLLILYCGQYYADFHNENLRCRQLEQKTRVYHHKLKILENNLASVSDELNKLRCQNIKLNHQKDCEKGFVSNIPILLDNPGEKELNQSIQNDTLIVTTPKKITVQFDLTSHLSLVKKMLNDQDNMIQSLNQLSNEFSEYECDCSKKTMKNFKFSLSSARGN